MREAVRYTLGREAGESQGDLEAFDQDLARWIAMDQTSGDANLATGSLALNGWQWIPVAVWVLIVGLVYVGIRPRLREYPGMSSIIVDRLAASR
jgi:hypothetical protein